MVFDEEVQVMHLVMSQEVAPPGLAAHTPDATGALVVKKGEPLYLRLAVLSW